MADKIERRLADTNAVLMGHGVGVATLEAMFNLVNSQSILSATMLRDHELSHPIQMQALSQALSQLLAASEAAQGKGGQGKNVFSSPVPVNFPPNVAPPAPPPPVTPEGQKHLDLGAVSDLSALDGMKNGDSSDGREPTLRVDSSASHSGMDEEMFQQLMLQFMDMITKLMAEMMELSQPHLEVT